MANPLRELVERLLPWYSPAVEAVRDARTARIAHRSEEARGRAAAVIAEYRKVEAIASGDRLFAEVERPSDVL